MNPTNLNEHITPHFTVKEAIWLPSWDRAATEADGLNREVQHNLLTIFHKLEVVRCHFNRPIIVHCAYRPSEYNAEVGGSSRSQHVSGSAVDFHVKDIPCDIIRLILEPKLIEFGLRMEWKPGARWIHLDNKSPAGRFIP